jgi:hypothetical protein
VATYEEFSRAVAFADFEVGVEYILEFAGMQEGEPVERPAWVRRCADKAMRALFPKAFEIARAPESRKAYSMGIAFGMMEAGQRKLAECADQISTTTEGSNPSSQSNTEIWKWIHGQFAAQSHPSPDRDLISAEDRAKVKHIEGQLNATDLAEYHQGMADAARMFVGDNKATEATTIYAFMLTYWRVVERLKSAEQLLDLLTKVYGQNLVGNDPARIAQLARRVGKTFRKPGRPPKTRSP